MSLSLEHEIDDIFQKALNYITESWDPDFDVKMLVATQKARVANIAEAVRFLDSETWTIDEVHKVYYIISKLYLANHERYKGLLFLEKALNASPQNVEYLSLYASLLENRVVPDDSVDRTSLLSNILDLNIIRPSQLLHNCPLHLTILKELVPMEGPALCWERSLEIIRAISEFGFSLKY